MNLKEAFRYQNFLDRISGEALQYLGYNQNVTKTTQEHLRSKANPDAENETVDTTSERRIQHPVTSIVDFVVSIVREKEFLSTAIDKAKATCGVDIDSSIATNKCKQNAVRVLSAMGNIKSTERVTRGQAYKFNNEGNQTAYQYEVKEVSTIDFDRNKVKAIAKTLIGECDDVSARIDKVMIDTVVDYNPPYDVNDTFEDVLDIFVG